MANKIQRVNYHTHCERCRHARGSAVEYVEEAVRANVSCLGFSDHMPFYDDRFGLRMPYEELEDYLLEITALREAYRDSLKLTRGFEGEYVVIPHFIYFQLQYTSVKFNKAPASNKMTFTPSNSLIPGFLYVIITL